MLIKMTQVKPDATCNKQESRHKNTWKRCQNTVFWCNLKLSLQRALQFYQTRSNAVILFDTLLAEFVEKAICMKTKDQLHQRESVILRPRVVLEANSQSGSQNLPVQEARSPWESQQDAESDGETRSNTADYRMPDVSISAVRLRDARRQNDVTELIEMFEKHQHREQFLKDVSQKQEINKFSEESQTLLVDMNHTEIFELCENSAKHQCLDCNAFFFFRNRDHLLHLRENFEVSAESYHTPEDQLRLYFNPWLSSRRIPVEDQRTVHLKDRSCSFFKAKETLKKARQEKHGSHPTILSRWYAQENTEIRWRSTILAKKKSCFSIASLLKDTTKQLHELNGCRTPNIGFLVWMRMDGPQNLFVSDQNLPLAWKQCLKMQDAHLAETQQPLRPIRREHQQRQRPDQQFEDGENFDYCVDRKTGRRYYREPRRNPLAASSSSTSQWQTSQWQTSRSSWHPTSSGKWWWFRFLGRNSRKSTGVVGSTPTHNTHLCSRVCSQARNAHATRLAQELQCHLYAPEKNPVIWCVACLILGCLTCLSPRALHLHHSLFLQWHKNTQHNRYNKSNSENIPHIYKLPQLTSYAIKNHSGVKTCRVAETRAPQLPHNLLQVHLQVQHWSEVTN